MIDVAYVQRMARYNRWQNDNLYGVADALTDDGRRLDRGAFFGSIHNTLSHLLWGDTMWMSRFTDVPKVSATIRESATLFGDWNDLKQRRAGMDARMQSWAGSVDQSFLAADLTWFSSAIQREVTKPVWQLVVHMFNHQTHHRGQVHAMLTQAGGKPSDTDLFIMPE
jgi:uncharacterized damage-inducible protein DinB